MESKTIDEIVNIEYGQEQVNEIIEQFIISQSKCGNQIFENSPQYTNIKLLTQLLFYKNQESVNVPIVATIPMGQGKSCLLIEFIRFMYQYDSNFGAIIVKRTIDECKDFAIDSGLVEIMNCPEYEELFLSDTEERRKFYDEKENLFKVLVVRGFNFKDCNRYTNKESWFGKAPPDAVDYDYRLCKGCFQRNCTVKKSKENCEKHRILSITHNRLFLSTDIGELLENIMYFKNDKGELTKRQLLIIDEKIEMCDIQSITINQYNKLKEIIDTQYTMYGDLFDKIHDYLRRLKYPDKSADDIIKQDEFYPGEDFAFDEELRKGFYINKDIIREQYEQLLTLEKLLRSKNITTSIKYVRGRSRKKNNLIKQVTVYNYINLESFHILFEKSIVLDATAKLDMDYGSSNILFCKEIIQTKLDVNIFIPLLDFNVSKSRITGASLYLDKEVIKSIYDKNIENIVKECNAIITSRNEKTLIVVYKDIDGKGEFNFKKDISMKLKDFQLDKSLYKIIHHGQFSTGVNHLSDFNNVIIIGQLNKSSTFYQNKALSLGLEFVPKEEMLSNQMDIIQEDDYCITTIQQIGRSSLRKGITPNIYILHKADELNQIVSVLKFYFSIVIQEYQNNYYNTERKERVQNGYNNIKRKENSKTILLVNHLKSLSPGIYKRKKIQEDVLQVKDNGQFSNIVKDAQNYLDQNMIENIKFQGRIIIISAIERQ